MAEIKKIRTREEIPMEDKWATEDLYPSDEAWEQELATIAADQEKAVSFAGHLGDSAEMLFGYLDNMEKTEVKIGLLANYCMRKADEDTRNAKYQAMKGKFMSVMVALSAACSFETPEIMAIPEEKLAQFYADCPQLERYRRYLNNTLRMKAHTLNARSKSKRLDSWTI